LNIDKYKNVIASNNIIPGVQTLTTTTTQTFTVTSPHLTICTASASVTYQLPAVSTLSVGTSYDIMNTSSTSSVVVTINSSGGNAVCSIPVNGYVRYTSNVNSGTGASVWSITYNCGRKLRRVITTTQSATPTINTDNTDLSSITGLAQAITSMTTNLTGTPQLGDLMEIDITDNGTARAITWGTSFASSGNVSLPTTTVLSVLLHVYFEYDTASSKWVCVGVA
jgi:hypothetical protein